MTTEKPHGRLKHHGHPDHRFDRLNAPSLRNWGNQRRSLEGELPKHGQIVDCGWGRLIFAHTYDDPREVVEEMAREQPGRRDIAMYSRDPHVTLALAPLDLFLDPSHTFRLRLDEYRGNRKRPDGIVISQVTHDPDEIEGLNRVYLQNDMVTVDESFFAARGADRTIRYLVARDARTQRVVGVVMGVDHKLAFDDPENGSSLWSLAVDPQCPHAGTGEALVRALAEKFQARGRAFMDLSVMHDNEKAITLYRKLGFQRVPVFAIKRRNPINERLYVGPKLDEGLNPYAKIIVDEARRRGIAVDITDAEHGYFTLSFGGRVVHCREALSDLTSAVAMSRCDNKAVTRRFLERAGLRVPRQIIAGSASDYTGFLNECGAVVVKPARGEQGHGISIDLRTPFEVESAINTARQFCDEVVIEECVQGLDLRVIVMGGEIVAAAIRRPAEVTGTGSHAIHDLIDMQSHRRSAATGGESRIPLDAETERCVAAAGYAMESVLPEGETIAVRKTANLHTGGTIHDVTDELDPSLADAAAQAARALDMPVVGMDLLVPDHRQPRYAIIEANERPGLANHEPQPTAQKFIDLLFPQTAPQGRQRSKRRTATGA
jgi:GNAT-family acetyltransferase (TIGR03103 family)